MAKISNLDYYAILGVHPNAEDIVIRAAFKALAQRYHPDRFTGSKEEAHRRMVDLTNAYETLADPARRRKYDRRRGLSGRTAKFYFKNPARDKPLPFGALAARAAAAKQRKYRAAVYVLMAAVMILSAFNIHQHSAQILEFFASSRAPSGANSDASTRGAAGTSAPTVPDVLPSGSPLPGTTANVRILPIGQGGTRPIGPNAVAIQASPPHASDPAAASATPPPTSAAKGPARPIAAEPSLAIPAPPATPPAAESARKEARRTTAKPVVAKTFQPDRPSTPPPAAETEVCKEVVAALGLCNRNGTAKGQ